MGKIYIIIKENEIYTIKNVMDVMSFDNSTILYAKGGEVLAIVPKHYLIYLQCPDNFIGMTINY